MILRKFYLSLFEKIFFFFGIERTTRLGQKRSSLFANGMLLLPLEYSCLHRVEQSKYYPSTGKTRLNGQSSSSFSSQSSVSNQLSVYFQPFPSFFHLSSIFPFHFYSFAVQERLGTLSEKQGTTSIPKKERWLIYVIVDSYRMVVSAFIKRVPPVAAIFSP